MPNSYFSFKEFTIQQDKTAMKVCTDSCLFAAWVAEKIEALQLPCRNILDIGTGTGVLSLMLAQKTKAVIDAVEIQTDAYGQAAENFRSSLWTSRLNIFNNDIKGYKAGGRYDLIISNPPFFENDLRSPDDKKNKAKHNGTLSLAELLESVDNNLQPEGNFAVLLPFHRSDDLEKQAMAFNLFVREKLLVRQTAGHGFFRSLLLLSRNKQRETINSELIIHNAEKQYSPAFTALLKDYYLNL